MDTQIDFDNVTFSQNVKFSLGFLSFGTIWGEMTAQFVLRNGGWESNTLEDIDFLLSLFVEVLRAFSFDFFISFLGDSENGGTWLTLRDNLLQDVVGDFTGLLVLFHDSWGGEGFFLLFFLWVLLHKRLNFKILL